MTVGEKNPNKPNKTILLVGETGAGKSTLINALINYSMGVTFEDEVWFQIVEDEIRSCTRSQTSDVIVYEIFGFEDETLPYSLTIIDTPGYGNTRGIEHDDIISQRLLDLFRSEDGIHEVHAVGLVMKACDNRLSDRLIYIFDSMMSLFEKDMEKNIIALITHSNGRRPENAFKALEAAKIKCAKNEKNQPVHFLFDNCQHEDRTEEEEELEHADKISMRGMRELSAFLEKSVPQKLEKTLEVMNERIRLRDCIQNLRERIELTERKQAEIRETEEALKRPKQLMKLNESTPEVYKDDKQDYEWKSHYSGCITTSKPEHCAAMKDGVCTVCTRKRHASDSAQEDSEPKKRKVHGTKQEFNEKNKTEKLTSLENLEQEMNQLAAEKKQLLDEAYQHVIRLVQIALKAHSESTFVHLDFLIEKMKEEGDTEKVQKLEEMRSREDEGTSREGVA